MTESVALKDYFSEELAHHLSTLIVPHYPSFQSEAFIDSVKHQVLPLQLKARVAVISQALKEQLPDNYPDSLAILLNILGPENKTEEGMFTNGYFLMPIAHFVETYGLNHYHLSMQALYQITKRHTAEYALRPYLAHDPEQTLEILTSWLNDTNSHVRRLVSEGTRPRLPWAKKIDVLKGDITYHFQLLQPLVNDPSPYVRKSVANHINDLTKTHPEQTLSWLRNEITSSIDYNSRVIQQGLRTLKKQGDARALDILNDLE
ncbi:DNA alkylation repair protein [Halalkalibacter sp. APA_J-10(15)]|uniref:DNA alkylation repair protein n=1 Tax=unclassified Halalkalibacter TaxID=2893063 RepID=UPI001FF396A6|nr:DNA alkylation repair protein [Halalkalibacter sp. APA_J-10(15)]MCK0472773.1 DNA alkylation repair protein [Halalkalibacter sp. APA_J-10(15)]